MYYCCGMSDVGTVRDHNEDAFLINKIVMSRAKLESVITHPFIVAVADGVAGERSGEVASRLCLELLGEIPYSSQIDLDGEIRAIHEKIRQYGLIHRDSRNMQTTLCALAVDELGMAYAVNVGDSRMYRLSEGKMSQITRDQSLVQFLYEKGEISAEELLTHEKKHMIFPVLGSVSSDPAPDVIPLGPFQAGDLYLLCTDGVSDTVSPEEMRDLLLCPDTLLSKRLTALMQRALDQGSRDNVTLLAVSAKEE